MSKRRTWHSIRHKKVHGTGLKDDLLATDASSLQVDEGSHLLGPGMLGNEAVAGLGESGRQMRSAPEQKQPLPGERVYL